MNTLLNFKSFLKFLSKNKSYSFINVFGLSVSLMFVILITIYTTQELSTDRFHEKGDQVYALAVNQRAGSTAFPFPWGEVLTDKLAEIQKVSPITALLKCREVSVNGKNESADFLMVEPNFFDFFSFPLTSGNKDQLFTSRNYAVISETFANRAFLNQDPLGQTIKLNDSLSVVVNGVMKDIQNSAIPYGDILFSHENLKYYRESQFLEFDVWASTIFFMTTENAHISTLEENIKQFLFDFLKVPEEVKNDIHFTLIPLKELYFSPFNSGNEHYLYKGDWTFVIILISVGMAILIFAIINYINLTVAQNGFRAKEMAIRSLLGSSRFELFGRMIMESTMVCFISLFVGFLLLFTILPSANQLLETTIYVDEFLTPVTILFMLLFVLIMGFITGALPAWIISKTKPVEVVKGGFRTKTKMVFSKFFITFQNTITIILIAVSITMIWQTNHLVNAPLGYNKDNIIYLNVYGMHENQKQIQTLINELNQQACVKRATGARGTPVDGGNNHGSRIEGREVAFQILGGDEDYFDMLGIQIIKENNLAGTSGYYVTQQAMREAGLDENSLVYTDDYGWSFQVAGIVKDFYLHNIVHGLRPILLEKMQPGDNYYWQVLVEITGDHHEAFNQVKSVYEGVTQVDFNGVFMDAHVQATFENQIRLSRMVSVFAFIAIVISLLGLLAMSTYFIQQRSREVAVRKVFGSTNEQVINRLVFTFLNYVFIAFVIATPFIWYLMREWLSSYSYRITLSPVIFIGAGVFCLTISFVTVFWQSLEAANTNPIESIKTE